MVLLGCFVSLNSAEGVIYLEKLQEHKATIVDAVDTKADLIINGGYFDIEQYPVGFFKRNGVVKQKEHASKLSGYILIDKAGRMTIARRAHVAANYQDIIQTGPFLIDPGGTMGIKKDNKRKYDRMVLLKDKQGNISLLFYPKISLYNLALYIQKTYPNTDAALNLDGGPSCCIKGMGHAIVPKKKLPYYIGFMKTKPATK